MYIERLSLRNFKCFEQIDVALSKITLLTGANSSGKSSLLYGLLGPFQSEMFPLHLSPNGKYVNMGDYREIAFNNSVGKPIGIDMIFSDPDDDDKYSLKTTWVRDKRTSMPKLHILSADMAFMNCEISSSNGAKYALKLSYEPAKHIKEKSERKFYKAVEDWFRQIYAEVPRERRARLPRMDLLSPYKVRRRVFDSVENMVNQFPPLRRLYTFGSFMDREINFVSSFRLQPERTYYQRSHSGEKIGTCGENHIDQIVQWEREKSSRFRDLKKNLKELKLLNSLRSRDLRGGRFELRVRVHSAGVWALLSDVGFGISQFLPIIVADLQLHSGSTLFLAQPEIHLHPSVQASLADYFVKQAKEKGKRYVIETHSEYLINRLRLAVTQKRIKPEDLSIYYLEAAPGGTRAHKVVFTERGQIQGAPKSFFDTYMIDVMDIALNAQ